MRYVTIAELSDMIRKNLWKIPHDIDLVVGVPRSGLMVANMIALYLNKRLSDIDSFQKGTIYSYGERRALLMKDGPIKKVLIVDDTAQSGGTLTKTKEKISHLSNDYTFCFFVPIISSKSKQYVDYYAEIIDDTRLFEWNLYHRTYISESCFDLDGVLCPDPPMDDDGPIYQDYIRNAKPYIVPSAKIGTIITCRLEKYREITEDWLKRNKIEYERLIMLDLPDKSSRIVWGKYGEYKGEYYRSLSDSWLFFESSPIQAQKIANIAKKTVICTETNMLVEPAIMKKSPFQKKIKLWIKRIPLTRILYTNVRKPFRP